MSWQYRIFHTRYAIGVGLPAEESFAMREVLYTSDGRVAGISREKVAPEGETLEMFIVDLAAMRLACTLPVLTPDDVPDYQYDTYEVPLDETN